VLSLVATLRRSRPAVTPTSPGGTGARRVVSGVDVECLAGTPPEHVEHGNLDEKRDEDADQQEGEESGDQPERESDRERAQPRDEETPGERRAFHLAEVERRREVVFQRQSQDCDREHVAGEHDHEKQQDGDHADDKTDRTECTAAATGERHDADPRRDEQQDQKQERGEANEDEHDREHLGPVDEQAFPVVESGRSLLLERAGTDRLEEVAVHRKDGDENERATEDQQPTDTDCLQPAIVVRGERQGFREHTCQSSRPANKSQSPVSVPEAASRPSGSHPEAGTPGCGRGWRPSGRTPRPRTGP